MEWETVIGLEVHAQLATKSKIFSGSSTTFGAEPNIQASALDLAMPGTLPTPNEKAFRYAIMFGLAIGAKIAKISVFERKNYFYPDLPKGYQTTQLEKPIVGSGEIEIELPSGAKKTIRIHHAHLEEDAGKSLHEDFEGMTGVDLNRAGTPLIEIVSEPDISNAAEAVAFAKKLHSIVTSLGICDGEMSQGSMRFDVNISIRRPGEALGTRTETKNLNSFKFMEDAISMEVERQIYLIENGEKIIQETRLYNGDTKESRPLRSKEEANDYRYFPCPDLLPIVIEDAYIEKIRKSLPELPDTRYHRFIQQYELSTYDASILSGDRAMGQYFETAVKTSGDIKLTVNWILGELSARLNSANLPINLCPVTAGRLAGMIFRIQDGTISGKMAKQVFDAMWNGDGDADIIIKARGLKQVSDDETIELLVNEALAKNSTQVSEFCKAEETKRSKMLGYFVGQIMKASKGQANPKQVNDILLQKLNGLP
jgi:aspartyl-tRNA(Asn)/glutamyl-tRNA(Gln) amidotransferase subunit B|tara:strand:+ start:14213 stop:15661 length:1449 start_codon:yes stop_codon:yes gene_type:complete